MSLVKGVLIQGEVTFTISIDTLVDMEVFNDEDSLKDLLTDMAIHQLDSSETEVEIMNAVDVILTDETFETYNRDILGSDEWMEIITEKRLYIQ